MIFTHFSTLQIASSARLLVVNVYARILKTKIKIE